MTVTKTSLASSFTLPVQFVKCGKIFLELNSETVSKFRAKKEKRRSLSCVHVFYKTNN